MDDLFDEDEGELEHTAETPFVEEEIDAEVELLEIKPKASDARRRLESMLDERRLRNELDDFLDY